MSSSFADAAIKNFETEGVCHPCWLVLTHKSARRRCISEEKFFTMPHRLREPKIWMEKCLKHIMIYTDFIW